MPKKKNDKYPLKQLQQAYDEFISEMDQIKKNSEQIKQKYIKQIEQLKKKELINKINQ